MRPSVRFAVLFAASVFLATSGAALARNDLPPAQNLQAKQAALQAGKLDAAFVASYQVSAHLRFTRSTKLDNS